MHSSTTLAITYPLYQTFSYLYTLLTIHSNSHLPVHSSSHPFTMTPVYICVSAMHLPTLSFIHFITHLFHHPSIHPSCHLSILPSHHPSMNLSIHLCIHGSMHPSIRSVSHPSLHSASYPLYSITCHPFTLPTCPLNLSTIHSTCIYWLFTKCQEWLCTFNVIHIKKLTRILQGSFKSTCVCQGARDDLEPITQEGDGREEAEVEEPKISKLLIKNLGEREGEDLGGWCWIRSSRQPSHTGQARLALRPYKKPLRDLKEEC